MITRVFANLKDGDKNRIYLTLINNQDCLEWSFAQVQELNVKYLIETLPDQYVFYYKDNDIKDYLELAKSENKTIFQVTDEVYSHLKNSKQNVYWWALMFLANKYNHLFINNQLSNNEQRNLHFLKQFCNYFVCEYLPFKEILAKYKKKTFCFFVIDNCINHVGYLSLNLMTGIIDKDNLSNFAKTMQVGYEIIKRYDDANHYDLFTNAWVKATIEFFSQNSKNGDDNEPLTDRFNH